MINMMKFCDLFKAYITRSNLKNVEIAKRIDRTKGYITGLANGHELPPAYSICEQLCYILKLSETERKDFLATAFYERLNDDEKKYLEELNLWVNKQK